MGNGIEVTMKEIEVTTQAELERVCKEGPVFLTDDLVW